MTDSKANKQKRKDPDEIISDHYAAKRFVQARKNLGLTQTQLIDLLTNMYGDSVDAKTLYRWENGKTSVPAAVLFRLEMMCKELAEEYHEEISKELVFSQKQNIFKRVLAKMNDYINKG